MSSPDPGDDGAPALLLTIPIEVRHLMYGQIAADRSVKSRDTLRYWFEKTDIQDQITEKLSANPDANVIYKAGYNHRYNEEDEAEDDVGAEVAVVDGQDDDDDEDEEDDEDE